jgi:Sugar (pentulose and hexulose) kinases
VEVVQADEGAALGAALLAGVGAGNWSSVDDACDTAVRVADEIQPNAENVEILDAAYQAYRKVYPALRQIASSVVETVPISTS